MFKRTLQVKVVKDKRVKNQPEVLDDEDIYGKIVIVNAAANNFVNECGKLMITYMVFDTARKVLVALASK